ncbi:MAG: hypothetical protein KTR18_09150 [Acidiferrobacterales bacterium]|nr:hypothetical protein [Acidiferrobacterales bacterium]
MNEENNQAIVEKIERVANKIVNLNGITRFNYLVALEATYREYLDNQRNQEDKRLLRHGFKAWSQNDEDGILEEIFRRVGTESKTFIEFGVEDGLECNTLYLTLSGWKGLWMDGSPRHLKSINSTFRHMIEAGQLAAVQAMINAENINELISTHTNGEIDLLSIDIDRNDYWVWKAISGISPRVVVVEYNATIRPPISVTVKYDASARWNGSNYFGASLSAFEKLGKEKGYSLVGCSYSGSNAFFVRDDLIADRFCAPFTAENHYEPPRYHVWLPGGHKRGFGEFEPV